MPLKSNCNHIVFIMEGKQKKNTFRFENTSLRFTIVEHIVLRIIGVLSDRHFQEFASNECALQDCRT